MARKVVKKRVPVKKAAPEKRSKTFKAKKRKVVSKPKKLGSKLPWRVAYSLDTLLDQINAKAPNRSKVSDGSIGDAAHQARTSDHNAWRRDKRGQPVVGARDFTHDPRNGVNSYAIAQSLAKSRDKRISYIISNGKIWNHTGGWRKYNGKNPHDHHVHVSVSDKESLFDSRAPWFFDMTFGGDAVAPGDIPALPVPNDPILRRGSEGEAVKLLQNFLNIQSDGDFGPATERAVKAFQVGRGLVADGVVGPATWRALRGAKLAQGTAAAPSSHQQIFEYIAIDEGRDLNVHPDEPGGASRLGISLQTMSRHLGTKATIKDLEEMTDAMAWDIYDALFWDMINADRLPAGLNYAAFDFAVNSGPAIVDGDDTNNPKIVEDFLAQALREKTVTAQIDKLCDLRIGYMKRNPEKWERYKRGWTARVDRVRARAHNMAGV